MNIWDVLILLAVVCIVVFALWRLKSGKVKGCSCPCSSCSCNCGKDSPKCSLKREQ